MSQKTFFEIFDLYKPSEALRDAETLLMAATDITVRADKAHRILEIGLHLPNLVEKATLYAIEQDVAATYKMNCVRILPRYPSELWDESYVPEVLIETERTGLVAKGFFSKYEHHGTTKLHIHLQTGHLHADYSFVSSLQSLFAASLVSSGFPNVEKRK